MLAERARAVELELEGASLGIPSRVPKFCIECGAPQIKCTNPKCNEVLFSDKTKNCHVCHAPQGAGIEAAHGPDSGSTSESTTDGADSRGGNHITAGDKPTKSVTDEDTAPTPPAAANDQPENQKEVKDIKTTTQTESPDPLNAQSDIASMHAESSTMISDSDESETFHSDNDGEYGTSVDKLNNSSPVSQIDQPLTRLSLRESRKHGLETGSDSEELNPKKN